MPAKRGPGRPKQGTPDTRRMAVYGYSIDPRGVSHHAKRHGVSPRTFHRWIAEVKNGKRRRRRSRS